MLSKAIIKLVRSLDQKKIRVEKKLFVTEGNKIVSEIINNQLPITYLVATKEWIVKQTKLPKTEIIKVTKSELKQISFQKTPQQVLAVCNIVNKELHFSDLKNELILALDNVQNPGNVGTIIRIADWFGIKNIVASLSTADIYNPKVIQASMGAFVRVMVHYVLLEKFLVKMKSENNLPIYGTTLQGKNIYNQKLSSRGIIVMGSEGNGISENKMKILTKQLYIPPFIAGAPPNESLNVAIATAIVCSEFRRQQNS